MESAKGGEGLDRSVRAKCGMHTSAMLAPAVEVAGCLRLLSMIKHFVFIGFLGGANKAPGHMNNCALYIAIIGAHIYT